jgi:4-alpha-glucanotransferase
MHQNGYAPYFCDAWIAREIINMHLSSPAMLSIFLLQDILATDFDLRRANPHEERINVPAIAKYYWKYRMHLTLEKLLQADAFNNNLFAAVKAAGR